MPLEIQNNFSGGLNDRYPAHLIPDGFNSISENVDLSYRDLRPDKGTGTDPFDPAGSRFFYEAASSWVGASGFSSAQYNEINLSNSANQTISTNTVVADPVTVNIGSTLTVSSGTLTVESQGSGFEVANSFVEYADDLYVSRSGYSFTANSILNTGANGVCEIVFVSNEVGKFHIGDEVYGSQFSELTLITDINKATGELTLSKPALVTTSSQTNLQANATGIRYMDGNISTSLVIGVDIPTPSFEMSIPTGTFDGYSKNWISSSFPIPFQYGVSALDNTGIESGLSESSDQGAVNILNLSDANNRSKPLEVNITGLQVGKYFLYRIGDTSAVYKLLEYIYQTPVNTTFNFGVRGAGTGVPGTAQRLSITTTDMPIGTQYAVRWYAATAASKASATSSDFTTTGTTPFTTGTTIDLYTNAATDDYFIEILVKFENDEREYVAGAGLIENTQALTNGNLSTYLDFRNAQTLALFSPFTQSNQPPRNLKFITEVNNFFFAAVEKRLYISRSGQANVWPIDAFIDFDGKITGLGRRGSELIVFTQFALFRVFGNAFDSMRKVEIPTREGIPDDLHLTIAEVKGGLIYANLNGIHYYDGSSVQQLTRSLVETFTLPSGNYSSNLAGTYDDQYFLLADAGLGYKIDMRDGAFKLSRTTLNASNLFYRGATNRLYTGDAIFGLGSNLQYTVQTRDFTGGQVTATKLLSAITINADSFTGSFTPVVDGIEQSSETVNFSSQDLNRKVYLSNPLPGKKFAVKIISTTGELNEVGVEYQDPSQSSLSRFDSITIKYTGTPSFSVKIDDTEKIASTTLPAFTGDVSEKTYYFPAMTEGTVPHLVGVETETSKIVSHSYESERV